MLGDVVLQLNPGVQLIPRQEWPAALRERHDEQWTAALSAPGLRLTSRLVDEPARRLLRLFREPATVTAAVLAAAREQGIDPIVTLESAVPLLESLLRCQLLVRADGPADAPPSGQLAGPGSVLHGWRVLEQLHALTDTSVFLVSRDGQQAILKTVSTQAGWQRAAIRNELVALQEISHPAVPHVIEADTDASLPYLVLQRRPGQHCTVTAARLRRLGMPLSRARLLELLARITAIYAELHALGVIHGDVQPRNVLADPDTLEVSVLDFGFARRSDGTAFGPAGAPHGGVDCYRAAELWRPGGAFRQATAASEQYAVGCLCFELATGSFPLDRSVSADDFRHQVATAPPLGFDAVGARGWADLESALAPALAADPADRYDSMSGLAGAVGTIWRQAAAGEPARVRRPMADPALALSGDGLADHLYPPTASVNYGAAGVAFAWYRRAQAAQDGALLACAHALARSATVLASGADAFANSLIGITPETVGTASLYHSALGVHLVEAIIASAAGERWQPALDRMLSALRPDDERLDLTTGRAGQLLACAHALGTLPAGGAALDRLRRAGDAALDRLWERPWRLSDPVPGCDVAYVGVAHGWAGVLFSTFTWCRVRERDLPRSARPLLAELIEQARPGPDRAEAYWPRIAGPAAGAAENPWPGWCHGSAGHVLLLCEVSRVLGSGYLDLAGRAARHAARTASRNVSLCCGIAGVAYALIALYRATASQTWLRRADQLATRAAQLGQAEPFAANSLFKGALAVDVLAADLRSPASAVMPMFEVERWPAPPAARNR